MTRPTKQKKSLKELQDEDERTSSMGLFNTAEAYRLSAAALEKSRVRSGHADEPVLFLYFHAIELYLKALLRQSHSVEKIRTKFGHKTSQLVKQAENLGFFVMDEDRKVFSIMSDADVVIESRYIRIGSKTLPTFEALNRTGTSLRQGVGGLLRDAGVMVRV